MLRGFFRLRLCFQLHREAVVRRCHKCLLILFITLGLDFVLSGRTDSLADMETQYTSSNLELVIGVGLQLHAVFLHEHERAELAVIVRQEDTFRSLQ